MRSSRAYKVILAGLIPILLVAVAFTQNSMNQDRMAMGITRGEPLGKSAPPVLAFTTVALGGFRGLIANLLWVRAVELQEQGKFFEKVQLADWITKLQPHFTSVWVFQAWDMAYNISVKFDSPVDRWQWVQRGLELLRDEALRFNPNSTLIYNQLAWIFQHKLGQDLDDAHMHYKTEWARQMDELLDGTNYVALIDPQTDDERERGRRLRQEYKLDPSHMLEVDQTYGPLEWRLPESHAIYWATLGLKKAKREDLITLRRTLYQPMQLAFRRGRLIEIDTAEGTGYQFGPNLDIVDKVNQAYEDMAAEDQEFRDHIKTAHRNFLKDAVYLLYVHNRTGEAQQWFDYLLAEYPNVLLDDARKEGSPSVPIQGMSLDDYAVARVSEVAGETSSERTQAVIEGILVSAFYSLATGHENRGTGMTLLAERVWLNFQSKTSQQSVRIGLPPMAQMKEEALRQFESTYTPELVARLRTRLGLPAAANSPPVTNSPPATAVTPGAAQ
jgi:hypothetical protein